MWHVILKGGATAGRRSIYDILMRRSSSIPLPGAAPSVWAKGCGLTGPAQRSIPQPPQKASCFHCSSCYVSVSLSVFCVFPRCVLKMMSKLGVDESWHFVDVLGLEEDQLSAVRKPCCALMLLFPLTQQHESFRAQQADQVVKDSEVYFLTQPASNSCGTIALLHAVANNSGAMSFGNDSPLKKFLDETANMSPDDRGKYLEKSKAIYDAHNEVAAKGQCQPEADNANFHFIAFVKVNGQLHELDGRLTGPLIHGPTKDESFITDAAKVCHEFVQREKTEVRFSAVALTKS